MMANILCVYENVIATVAITEKFFQDLSNYDNRVAVKYVPVKKLKKQDVSWCDVLYMIRPNNECFARIAKLAHRYGVTVAFFLDDDLMNLPKVHADMPWRKKGLANAARNSDIIVSSSPLICNKYGKEFNVLRTVIQDTAVPSSNIKKHVDNKNQKIKIVYSAGIAHKIFFDKYIKSILGDLDKRLGDKISLTFVGVHPDVNPSEYKMPITFVSPMPFDAYRNRMEQENFDIGLAPLDSNDFTKCKYFNKFLEYAMFGIVGIYSDTEPYTFVVDHKINGILVGKKPKDWLDAICEAVENVQLIESCRVAAYGTLKTKFDSTTIMNKFLQDIPEIIREHRNKQVEVNTLFFIKLRYFISRLWDWGYKSLFYFKVGGLREVLKGIKRRINTIRIEKRGNSRS
jgi:glycosyltransferase involved in cell wall biosynthesis